MHLLNLICVQSFVLQFSSQLNLVDWAAWAGNFIKKVGVPHILICQLSKKFHLNMVQHHKWGSNLMIIVVTTLQGNEMEQYICIKLWLNPDHNMIPLYDMPALYHDILSR